MPTTTNCDVRMSDSPSVSIVITCYNYGRYIRGSIESALTQTYSNTEVVVVDDGSTDDSAEIIATYGRTLVPVLKANGGQASAFNAGFERSHGDIVIFLDADDTLLPTAVERAVELFHEPGVTKVHWPLRVVDDCGRRTGGIHPSKPLSEGDLRDEVLRHGYEGYIWPVTSGNAWARSFLTQVLPMPEHEYTYAAESYLATLAPVLGLVRSIAEPIGTYRMHDRSSSNVRNLAERIKNVGRQQLALRSTFEKAGIDVSPDIWRPTPDVRQKILAACQELTDLLRAGSKFLFVEWEVWGPGQIVKDCRQIPFLERDGKYWGRPADSSAAIQELERLRSEGADYLVFAWQAFWWLDYYSEFHKYMRATFPCTLENDRLLVFDLSQSGCGREMTGAAASEQEG
jgi:glycosyl transferase family 2